jgi:2',3'-cyclic-nucleotide 2'-phosphodiesterase/3'-nucleotidase
VLGQRLSVFDIELQQVKGKWTVVSRKSTNLNTNTVQDDPAMVALVQKQHDAVVAYVNKPVATSTEELSAAESCWKDTAILDYVNTVQVDTV